MQDITADSIYRQVTALCLTAACDLPQAVRQALVRALENEASPLGRNQLTQIIENADIAAVDRLPICQDTGVAVYFVELGQEVHISGGSLREALNKATAEGWKTGYLRNSIVEDPLFARKNTGNNSPPIIHLDLVPGNTLKITLAPKGAGSENMSALAMLKPTSSLDEVADFIVEAVIRAGGNPCPPTIVGVGIGGNFETAPLLAKKALLREVGKPHPDARYAGFEKQLLERINASGLGPQGLGGTNTALAVHVECYPCHIASLPVAVNLNCHAARHASITLAPD